MFQRIYSYDLTSDESGRVFRPRVFGRMEPDLTWSGYLVFFPAEQHTPIATPRETTESSADALTAWAVGLSRVYLRNALARALQLESALLAAELRAFERLEREASEYTESMKRAAAVAAQFGAERPAELADARSVDLEKDGPDAEPKHVARRSRKPNGPTKGR
jgi:hypothetical protein